MEQHSITQEHPYLVFREIAMEQRSITQEHPYLVFHCAVNTDNGLICDVGVALLS